jgi:MscS family membrane protein
VLARLRGPLIALWAIGLMFAGAHWLDLHPLAEAWWMRLLRTALLIALFWTLLRVVEGMAEALAPKARAHGRAVALALLPIGVRVAKIAVVLMALIALLSEFGYPVASLLAGLGLGGLAIALAAQKTLEHVIGSVAISIDQPFRPGDRIKVDDLVGRVESVGLRSTRIRTADRTLVTFPNGRLADLRIENIGARDRMRFGTVISLPLDVPVDTVREVLGELRQALVAQTRISHEDARVSVREITRTSIDIDVAAWFETQDETEFQALRDELLLDLQEIAARAKRPSHV